MTATTHKKNPTTDSERQESKKRKPPTKGNDAALCKAFLAVSNERRERKFDQERFVVDVGEMSAKKPP